MKMKDKKESFSLALITGASSGIGEALAHLLAKHGIDLIISGRNRDRLEALAQDLPSSIDVTVIEADLAEPTERQQLIRCIQERVPDLVVNNAGIGLYGAALSHPTQEQLNILRINCDALLELSLDAARSLIQAHKQGVVMNISSAAAFQIFPTFSVYAASKSFVNAFSESFDEEVKDKGVRILAACPGMVATRFRHRAAKGNERPIAPNSVMTPDYAAQQIWWQICQRKPIHTFNWKFRLATLLTRYLVPKRFLVKKLRARIASLLQN